MSLRIAFCGPNPELNEKLIIHVKDLIGNEVVDVTVLPNAVREVIELTRRDAWKSNDIDWLNLWSASYRSLMQQGAKDDELVLSSGCSVDQVVMQAAWLADQESHAQSGLLVADITGATSGLDEALLHRCGSVLQVILNQTEEDIAEYWDFVYAVLPADAESSSAPSSVLNQYTIFIRDVPIFKTITILPDNETSAMDVLSQEAELWKEKLKSS